MTIRKDPLAGVFRYKKETNSVEECKELKQRIDQLENTISALKLTNSQLAEALLSEQTKSVQPGTKLPKFSFID